MVKNGFKINKMEFSDQIVVGETCKFNFSIPSGILWATFNGTDLGDVTNGQDFEISCLEPGTVTFYYALPSQNQGWSLISYKVTSSRSAPQENAARAAFASY